MSLLEQIITHGNRSTSLEKFRSGENWITCADGFRLSVIAGYGAYCTPRIWDGDDYPGPYTHVEVWPNDPVPGSWHPYRCAYPDDAKACKDVCHCIDAPFATVPVDMVRDLINSHGGER